MRFFYSPMSYDPFLGRWATRKPNVTPTNEVSLIRFASTERVRPMREPIGWVVSSSPAELPTHPR